MNVSDQLCTVANLIFTGGLLKHAVLDIKILYSLQHPLIYQILMSHSEWTSIVFLASEETGFWDNAQ